MRVGCIRLCLGTHHDVEDYRTQFIFGRALSYLLSNVAAPVSRRFTRTTVQDLESRVMAHKLVAFIAEGSRLLQPTNGDGQIMRRENRAASRRLPPYDCGSGL